MLLPSERDAGIAPSEGVVSQPAVLVPPGRHIGQADGLHLNFSAYPDCTWSHTSLSNAAPVEEDTTNKSFTPVRVGRYTLPNRLVMAPMTRSRAKLDGAPGDLAAEYYAQRAGVGLIRHRRARNPPMMDRAISQRPASTPPPHVAGWKKVTRAVHDKGGRIFFQLMHAGRMSHPDNTPHHRRPVAPSAIAPGAQMFTATRMKDIPAPRALTSEEVRQTVADFRHAARAATR
jgi:2,4-dienoyl-CoA reductase-like NADH-dependent reductase (Old Yellow Enzyme family)